MKALLRRRFLAGLLAATGFSAGCGDLGSFVYFLMPEQKTPAAIKSLATDDKKKEVKAMILIRNGPEMDFRFMNADRQLSALLHTRLQELCKANQELLTLVLPTKVDAFKNTHPDWHEMAPAEIGADFKVDYVIYIEINWLSLYEQGSNQLIYRGKADLSVKLIDIHHPDESSLRKDFNCTYPSEANFIGSEDISPDAFREKFLNYAAKRLSWYFAPHPIRDSHYNEFE